MKGSYALLHGKDKNINTSGKLIISSMKTEIVAWLKENHDRLLLFAGFILVGILAFEAGLIQGETKDMKPLVLSIPAFTESEKTTSAQGAKISASPRVGMEPVASVVNANKDCPLVGSKNSNKYHLSTCAVVKRIKLENRVCFLSKEDAEKKGYIAGCIQ